MKKLLLITATIIYSTSLFASCLETAQEDSKQLSRSFLQDTIETSHVTALGNGKFEVYAQTEVDPEFSFVHGTYQLQYNKSCQIVTNKVITPMTEKFDYPNTDYSRNDEYSCDHCN